MAKTPIAFVQDLLVDMRREQHEAHESLSEKVDTGFRDLTKTMSDHALDDQRLFAAIDARITPIESSHKTMRKAVAALIGATVVGVVDIVVNHVHLWKP